MIISDANEIVRARQAAIRRELDRRGIALKAVGFDSGIPYPTLLTYFPQEGAARPVMLPAAAIYALTEGKAIPDDLLSMLLPVGCVIVRVPEGVDLDDTEAQFHEWLAMKGRAHHPGSEAGREIGPGEEAALRARLTAVKAAA
ncbi:MULTISPECIES: hypothetical protein [unclassified Novosphingobium]|uniref:hypothetical protein n=1 Tax=unclassified Novosphingobium TaxID=2644732 RepID=UPI001F2D8910|nr:MULTISPECIES: hypothetical protein [unclassified Novosphingobium]